MILIYRFSETIPIAIGKFLAATSCSYLQQPSLSPAPQQPTPQVPSPGGREAVDAVVPLVPADGAAVLHQQPSPHSPLFYAAPHSHRGTRLTVVLHSAADRSLRLIGCSSVLRRLKLICSSDERPGVKSTCTVNSRVDHYLTLTRPMAEGGWRTTYVPIMFGRRRVAARRHKFFFQRARIVTLGLRACTRSSR